MKSSMVALAVGAALAGCSTGDGNVFASRDKTVEYYRVFDIKTDPSNPAVVKAASEGISKHVADATLATPGAPAQLQEQPGHFKLADASGNVPPGAAPGGPSCEGAVWTAKATPRVNGGDNMNMIACLFPYKDGYHLDMYAAFTEKEGGWLEWPRRFKGRLMGTPESWTDKTMIDVVRNIRDSTGAQVALVEARPALAGTPWLQMAPGSSAPAGGGAASGSVSTPASPAPSAAPNGTGAASGVTSSAAPSPATGIAPIGSTPAGSSDSASSPSTIATNGTEAGDAKTDVK